MGNNNKLHITARIVNKSRFSFNIEYYYRGTLIAYSSNSQGWNLDIEPIMYWAAMPGSDKYLELNPLIKIQSKYRTDGKAENSI